MELFIGLTIPLLGTTLGSLLVFFMKKNMNEKVHKILLGFAGGVMTAASIWSLIDPSIELSESMGKLSFLPALIGFMIGIIFMLILDEVVPHTHEGNVEEGLKSNFKKTTKMLFAVTLHNIPEGMAVGVVFAGALYGNESITLAGALALSIGIAIQNFPEGSIISMPLYQEGTSKPKAFLYGFLSGIVEPLAALLAIGLLSIVKPSLPYILSFAAGAMVYVVIDEIIPSMQVGSHSNYSIIAFAIGFVMMMAMDIALG